LVKCWNYSNEYPDGIGNPPNSNPPADLDWDMWLGPAPKVPYNKNRWIQEGGWASFRYFWDYAGGWLTDWGVHLIDIVQWAMNVDAPMAVSANGGKFYLKDNRDTPDTLEAVFEYPNFICTYSNTLLNANGIDGYGYGIQFYGTNGTLYLNRDGYKVIPQVKRVKDKKIELMEAMESKGSEQHKAHVRNFIDCVKSRKMPISDIENCHRSSSATFLGNIAYLTKQRIEWDAKNEKITNSVEANKLLKREYRAPWKLPE
jgi:predicted dehydrogenase